MYRIMGIFVQTLSFLTYKLPQCINIVLYLMEMEMWWKHCIFTVIMYLFHHWNTKQSDTIRAESNPLHSALTDYYHTSSAAMTYSQERMKYAVRLNLRTSFLATEISWNVRPVLLCLHACDSHSWFIFLWTQYLRNPFFQVHTWWSDVRFSSWISSLDMQHLNSSPTYSVISVMIFYVEV